MTQIYNFCAGPAVLPQDVLLEAQQALLDFKGQGTSIVSISHRSQAFAEIMHDAEQDLRELMNIPDHYRVFFVQGGATIQFSMVPMNLMRRHQRAEYVLSGFWSQLAAKDAAQYGKILHSVDQLDQLLAPSWPLAENLDYVHCTPNETIHGVEFNAFPDLGDVPLVGDISSTILSQSLDVSRFGLLYAGAQKNIGPSGITLVIIREDLIGEPLPGTPRLLQYQTYEKAKGLPNTPPVFAWYVCGLVFTWLKAQGGVSAMAEHNRRKAEALYHAIDDSGFYQNRVPTALRSRMNVVFHLPTPDLDKHFVQHATEQGLLGLGGHRNYGGIRASLYNAMPYEGVAALIAFMQEFEQRYG